MVKHIRYYIKLICDGDYQTYHHSQVSPGLIDINYNPIFYHWLYYVFIIVYNLGVKMLKETPYGSLKKWW